MKRYRTLLASQPLLRRLAAVQLISYFASWFSNVAIYSLLITLDASAMVIAVVAALHFLPGVLQAPFSGVLIDRIAPQRLMPALIIIQIGSTLPLLLIDDLSQLWLLFGLIFVRMGAASFYFTLEMALLPRILPASDLKAANEIHSMIWSFSYTVGMAVSGAVVYAVGIKIAFVLDAMLYGMSLMLLLTGIFPHFRPPKPSRYLQMMRESLEYVRDHPLLLHLMLVHALVSFTTFDALVALLADRYYGALVAAPLAIGLLHALRAVGLVIGPMLIGHRLTNARLTVVLLFQGGATLLWAAVQSDFYLSLAASVLVGLCTTTIWSYTYTLIQQHTDETFYGRVIAYNDMIFLLSIVAVSMLVGVLAQWQITLPMITVILGSGFLFGALYYDWVLRRYDIREVNNV